MAIKEKYVELVQEYNKLASRYNQLLQATSLHPDDITYERFCRELRYPYEFSQMPSRSGIYAYHNVSTGEIYVGQSVNMKTRLVQHFRNGVKKKTGHDSQFKNTRDWKYYVLEFIPKTDKEKLNEREAYWICLARAAVANKKLLDKKTAKEALKRVENGEDFHDLKIGVEQEERGTSINKTRGNNIKR